MPRRSGFTLTAEHRAKIGAALRGVRKSDAARAAMSAAKKGRPGRKLTDAEKASLRAYRLGKALSPEHRDKLRAAKLVNPVRYWLGKERGPLSPETKARQSASLRGKPAQYPMRRFHYRGVAFRSTWEVRAARALDALGVRWEYESRRFDLVSQTYAPDFYLPDDGAVWEVKGYFGPKSQRTVGLFREQYPEVPLVLLTERGLRLLEQAATERAKAA